MMTQFQLTQIKDSNRNSTDGCHMLTFDTLNERGLFDERLPRYTSYPPAPAFHAEIGPDFQADALRALDPAEPISLYLHIPFCERLCWFCACRTQGVRNIAPIESYLETLRAELVLVAAHLPGKIRLGQMHWGGGTPTILPPALIAEVAKMLGDVFVIDAQTDFSVEIDPTMVDAEKIAALKTAKMTRASIGVQDFAPEVQSCIGRLQSFDQTREAVDMLRDAGIQSLNVDLVYGLPFQSPEGFLNTLEKVSDLTPDRIALFGYAHVPHIAKRQSLIPEASLPDDRARFELFNIATTHLQNNEMVAIGIDHFAQAHDSMAIAAKTGKLRRNFQGYTVDGCRTLVGLGASSISRFEQGFVQNTAQTGDYARRIRAGELPGIRGYKLTSEDQLRGRIIEMLMCDFAIDFKELALSDLEYARISRALEALRAEAEGLFDETAERLFLKPQARPLVRRLAHFFDTFSPQDASYSRVS